MALTIRKITEEQKQEAMALTGLGTASGAVVECIGLARRYRESIIRQKNTIKELQERVQLLERVQEKLAHAADEALTIVRQRELL